MRGFIVNLFGPDGAGKTTLAQRLKHVLNLKRMHVIYTKFGTYTLPARLIENVLCRTGHYIIKRYPGRITKRLSRSILSRSSIRLLWSLSNFVGILIYTLVLVYIPLLAGCIIIIEDYIPRIIADYIYALKHYIKLSSSIIMRFIMRVLLSLYNNVTVRVYVDASYETIRERRREYTEPLEYIIVVKAVSGVISKTYPSLVLPTDSISVKDAFYTLLRELHIHGL